METGNTLLMEVEGAGTVTEGGKKVIAGEGVGFATVATVKVAMLEDWPLGFLTCTFQMPTSLELLIW